MRPACAAVVFSCALMVSVGCIVAAPRAFASPNPEPPAAPPQPTSDFPLEHVSVPLRFDSGEIRSPLTQRGVAYSAIVRARGRPWLRLQFDAPDLGRTPRGGQPTVLRITSLRDDAVQVLTANNLREWLNSSAYFNGDAVRLEVICDPDAVPSRLRMTHLLAGAIGPSDDGSIATICGATDDRILSSEPGNGRLLPAGCTAWIINDFNRTCLTAGHCGTSGSSIIEFNVPLSTAGGSLVHPPPQDQYAVDVASIQNNNGGLGNDYCYFGCFANSNTGLTPFQAQGAYYALAGAPPALASPAQSIRVTGFGTVSAPVSLTWNQAQKTHAAPYVGTNGGSVQYLTDTTGGNSGSPVVDLSDNTAIGIHTNGGCSATAGTNYATPINNVGLQFALAHPLGVCTPDPALDFAYPDGVPSYIDPRGDSIRVQVLAGNGGTPQSGTGQLHVDLGDGAGFVTIPMSQVSNNVYDALVPPATCGSHVRLYFSAQTTQGATINDPPNAPVTFFAALSVVSATDAFADNFQSDLGWAVSNSAGLVSGAWERGIPAGGGARNDPPTDADSSGQCYLTANAAGDTDIDGGSTTLTSPLLDASAANSVIVYSRWFVTNSTGNDDTMLVQVSSNNGASWVNLETYSGSLQQWVRKEWRIDQIAGITPSNQFRIRFTVADTGNAHVVEAGIDAVNVSVQNCGIPCTADVNHSSNIDVVDLLEVIGKWGPCAIPSICPADIDHNGVVNVTDLLTVIANWGPCP